LVPFFLLLATLAVAAGLFGVWTAIHGISARDHPTAAEELLARTLRYLAVPLDHRNTRNPLTLTPEILAEGRMHWADHCAACHGNDGRGQTDMGRNLYPKAPDMTLGRTQNLSDGELLAIIKNGIRLTGMPAWGNPSSQDDSQNWKLVHFIRHLPSVTQKELDQMKEMNPVSPMEHKVQQEEDSFLSGGDASEATPSPVTRPNHHPVKKEKP
jgi:mono/diheme cytochrome c family protein